MWIVYSIYKRVCVVVYFVVYYDSEVTHTRQYRFNPQSCLVKARSSVHSVTRTNNDQPPPEEQQETRNVYST